MLRRFLLALLLVCPGAAAAAPAEYAGMRFDAPDSGWTRAAEFSGAFALRREVPRREDGRAGGNALIAVQAPRPLAGVPFAEAFAAFAQLDALPPGRPLQTRTGVSVNGHPMAWIQRCCRARNGVYAEAHFIGLDTPRGAVFLMLAMIGTRREDTAPLEAEFAALVRSLRPSPGDRALDFLPAAAGGLEGVYSSMSSGLRPNAFGGMDFFADNEVMLFERGGLYARTLPPGGQDLAAFCRGAPRDCGFYRLSGSAIVTEDVMNDYGMLERKEEPLQRAGDGLSIGRRQWRPVAPFPADARLDGTWRYLHASSGQTAFSSGGVTVERVLTLTPDGRFTRTGFAGFSGSRESGGTRTSVVTGSRRPVASGRYRLEGYRLVLTGEDGTTETLSVFRPDGRSDGLLVIDGSNYLRRDGARDAAPRGR